MIPLMLVSALSYSVVRRFEPISLELKKIGRKVKAQERKDSLVLNKLRTSRMIETDYDSLLPDMTITDFIPILETSIHNTFPVVDREGNFLGIVVFSKIKELLFRARGKDKITMLQIMSKPKALIQVDESPQEIISRFESTLAYRLPVLEGKKYLGFMTKGTLLSEYRKEFLGERSG
jgi:CIC family chloride channel protein